MSTGASSAERLASRPRRERMTTTLIFALLIHGLILLGVGFEVVSPGQAPARTVHITLATTRADKAPREAQFVARFNQLGPGNTPVRGPARPAAFGLPAARARVDLAARLAQLFPDPIPEKPRKRSPARDSTLANGLVATTASSYAARTDPLAGAHRRRRAIAIRLAGAARGQSELLGLDAVQLPQLYGRHPKDDARATNARAALYTSYLRGWQGRIELIGTAQFAALVPAFIKRGHLTLSVTLKRDGSVADISIVKRSSHPALDAAALKIIHTAAPFPPFPPELRAHRAELTFTYRWNFIRNGGRGSLGLGG